MTTVCHIAEDFFEENQLIYPVVFLAILLLLDEQNLKSIQKKAGVNALKAWTFILVCSTVISSSVKWS